MNRCSPLTAAIVVLAVWLALAVTGCIILYIFVMFVGGFR